jgi:Domain of unknown function (DUF4276)
MKRIIIICEGQTEQEFCKDVLYSHFFAKNILIETPLIKKSGGGIVGWNELKKQIETHLKQEENIIVTTFIDYYGIQKKHNFPSWELGLLKNNPIEKMDYIENAMLLDILASEQFRFIPHIQLHEFEGLLFNNINVFKNEIPENEFVDFYALKTIIDTNPNPELINDGFETAPSKRLHKLIKGYNKIVYGAILAKAIGLINIRNKSPRFNAWISKLESI